MGKLSLVQRFRIWAAGVCFQTAARLWPDFYDVWLDDAPRRRAVRPEPQEPPVPDFGEEWVGGLVRPEEPPE